MKITCHCGAEWTGLRIEHCTACHETFTGTTSGDRHRVGKHDVSKGPDRRRCLSVEEMRERGMAQNDRGQWTNGGVSPWAERNTEDENPCSCGSREAYSLTPGEWIDHQPDVCRIVRSEVKP